MGFIDIFYTIDKDELLKIAKENKESLLLIIQNQTKIMAALDDLKLEVADLKVKVDAEQVQIQALLDNSTTTIAALNAQIAILEGQLATGATADQIAEVVTEIKAIKADIESTVADVVVPPPVEPPAEEPV